MVYDDGSHYILTTRDKFDVITRTQFTSGSEERLHLYSKEYFELVRAI